MSCRSIRTRVPLTTNTLARALLCVPAIALVLSGCSLLPGEPGATPQPSSSPSTGTAAPPEAPIILDPDILLLVQATATTDAGEQIELTARVHSSTAWNDPDVSNASRPEFMTSACVGYLDAGVFADQSWSFALIDYSAALPSIDDPWPAGIKLGALPTADSLVIAGGGILADDPDASADAPHCARDKVVAGAGDGTIVAGFEGDTSSSSPFTAWAQHSYGFRVSSGMTLTGCTITLTGPGELAGGGGDTWIETSNDTQCSAGSEP